MHGFVRISSVGSSRGTGFLQRWTKKPDTLVMRYDRSDASGHEPDYQRVNEDCSSRSTIRGCVDDLRFAALFLRSLEDRFLGRGYVAEVVQLVGHCLPGLMRQAQRF